MHALPTLLATAVLSVGVSAEAVTITADYSDLPSVFQRADGYLYGMAAPGLTDVTQALKNTIDVGISYWQQSILLPFDVKISFKLDITGVAEAAIALPLTFDANKRPATASIRISDQEKFFIDPTPNESSEFKLSTKTTMLGGGDVNIKRNGGAVAGTAAVGRFDMLTVIVHEIGHAIGFAGAATRFTDLAGATGTNNRKIAVPKALTGFAADFDVPIVKDSAHIDGTVNAGLFNDTLMAFPGGGMGYRDLPTAVDVYALCTVLGCSANQVAPNAVASAVPEPGQWLLMLTGAAFLLGRATWRRASAAAVR